MQKINTDIQCNFQVFNAKSQERASMQVIERIRQTLDIEQIFSTATTEVRQLLKSDRVAIFRFSEDSNYNDGEFVAEDVLPEFESVLQAKIHDHCFEDDYATNYQNGQIFKVSDIYAASLSDCHIKILSRFQVRASLIVPLLQGQHLWGLLCIHQCYAPRRWRKAEIEFVKRIASQLSVGLQQAELFKQSEQRALALAEALAEVKIQKELQSQAATHEKTLVQVIKRIRQSLDINQIFSTTTAEMQRILGCDRVVVYRFLSDWTGEFIFESTGPSCASLCSIHQPIYWDDTYLQDHQGGRYANHEISVIADVYDCGFSECHLTVYKTFQIRAFIIVPVFVGENLWGLLAAYQNAFPRTWQGSEVRLLEQVGDQLGVALQQAELLQELQQAKEKADAASLSKSSFLTNMSHELRTPLNAILGFSQLMCRDPNITPDQRENLDTINRSGAHLLNLINDVLEMSKIEAGQHTLNPIDFDLHALLDNLHEMFDLKAHSKGLKLSFYRQTEVPQFINTDERKLRQILINLLGNAIKFTSHGNINHRVMLTKIDKGNTVDCKLHIEIEDTGPGIPEEDLETIFNAFFKTQVGRQSIGGTGLGLPICRSFASLLGGDIKIVSQPNQGTTVHFDVPFQMVQSSRVEPKLLQRVIGLAPDQPNYRVLVVEDQAENRQLMMRLLQSVGFTVRAVNNGEEAIAEWNAWRPHLIWMDWQMPVMDGNQATQKIRALEGLNKKLSKKKFKFNSGNIATEAHSESDDSMQPQTIIIALTASIFETTRQEIFQAGCNQFVSKPFQELDIFKAMETHLNLDYLYETTVNINSCDHSATSLKELEQQMNQMPIQWLSSLHQAAIDLEEGFLKQHIEGISESHSSLAKALTEFLNQLQMDRLIDLAQNALYYQSLLST